MPSEQATRSIDIPTPYGVQRIVFKDRNLLAARIAQADVVMVVIDARVYTLENVQPLITHIRDSANESSILPIDINNYTKNTELLFRVFDAMGDRNLTRKSLLISVGGGSTSDLVGVAASLYMRGIDYVVIPTSFISMADTVISKVAVNHGATKNMIGSFRSPAMTFIDIALCSTHDTIHIVHGLVEILKQALLEHDQARIQQITKLLQNKYSLEDAASTDTFEELIRWSLEVKARYIVDDWYDTRGVHKALSLGHTLANYLEMKGEYHHAVAVTYGMLLEYILSYQGELITEAAYNNFLATISLFEEHFKQLDKVKEFLSPQELIPALQKDKISHFGIVRFVLPTENGYLVSDVSEAQLIRALKALHTLTLQTS